MAELPDDLLGKAVFDWKISDVGIWLVHIKLKKYVSAFKAQGIDGPELYELVEEDIPERLGVTNKAHKKKVWNAIKKLKYAQAGKEAKKEAKKSGGKKKASLAIEKTTNVGRKKEVASGLGVELYVAHTQYSFQMGCTFCQEPDKFALVFCPACGQKGDFLCEDCDAEVHHHAKRRNHIRTVISVYDLHTAGQVVIHFVRHVACRKKLLKKCRDTFDRFYSAEKRMHYYFNLMTGAVQWHKPYCLRKDELKPFMTYDDAAFKIQNMYHIRVAHKLIVEKLQQQFDKIYDRDSGHFYYFYNGIASPTPENPKNAVKSYLAVPVQWKKPKNLYSNDCKIVFTEDLAALRIQFAFRTMKAKQFMRILVRTFFQYCYDPITGRKYYRNTVTGHSMWRKPRMLGKELWDPTDVREWNVDEVAYFFRRMGFKKFGYVDAIRKYQVDGKLLLTFEWEDYNYMGMVQSMHIKQTLLQLHRREWYKTHKDHPRDIARRDRLRRHHNVDAAARLLQRKYRQRYARAKIRMFHEIIRVQKQKDEAEKQLREGQHWWPQRVKDFSGIDKTIKYQHGKRRLQLGVNGWGQYVGSAWVKGRDEMTDEHASRYYTAKLNEDETKMKFTGGDITDAMNAIDASRDHLGPGNTAKKKSSKRFN